MNSNYENLQEAKKLNQESKAKKGNSLNFMNSVNNNDQNIQEAKKLNQQSRQNKGK